MDLLILISGNKEKLLKKHNLSLVNTVKIDEKLLSKPNEIKKIIQSQSYDRIYFGTIDLSLQRFQFFIFLYIFLFAYSRGELIDYNGAKAAPNILQILLIIIPYFIFEVLFSAFAMIYYKIKISKDKKELLDGR